MKDIYSVISEINRDNKRSGNDAIYDKCNSTFYVDASAIDDEKKRVSEYFEGMLWLIGRSYAASPQRRSYGKSSHIKPDTIDGKITYRPIWPVRSENSGNGDFFTELAANIVGRKVENKSDYDDLGKLLQSLRRGYAFDITLNISDDDLKNSADIQLLLDCVLAVSKLNRLVKRSTEIFDLVDTYCKGHAHTIPEKYCLDKSIDRDYVYCKNQISFSSKFLHFFCPQSVFIIDQFSEAGGKYLFPKSVTKGDYVISRYPITEDTDDDSGDNLSNAFCFGAEFRRGISGDYKKLILRMKKLLLVGLQKEIEADEDEIKNLYLNTGNAPEEIPIDDNFFIGYMNHVLNSYALCLYIRELCGDGFTPEVSYPRLTDSVFMRTKPYKSGSTTPNILDAIYYHS